MNENRREFLKKAALFSGGAGLWGALPSSIRKAMAINPDPGTTFMDAEHVVILMQENRSFDHCFGKLKGVRGFNDPRAIRLPNKDLVWLQRDNKGQTFTPFRLNIKDTKATWMSAIPHSWENQVDARNNGKYDGWIEAKRPGRKEFSQVPMTMGYYDREDIPFYYAFADAFTVCDQHFCAALTGTTTNRNYLWAGKTVGNPGEKPLVRNGEHTYGKEVDWKTFPDRLQEQEVDWRVYQNEVSVNTLLEGEDESWLANFTDNNLEWFKQFAVRFTPGHYAFLKHHHKNLPIEITKLEKEIAQAPIESKKELSGKLEAKKTDLEFIEKTLAEFNPETFSRLSENEKELHKRAFTTNIADPDYHQTETLAYNEGNEKRSTKIPKGDIFHEFRKDVDSGNLPTVSWLVAPQKFSDHPSAPWYGAWYVSEALEILTKNPEVWKKTIFILNYDENDGYFDHIPPFVPPKPGDSTTGLMSKGLDAQTEYVTLEQELKYPGMKPENARESPVGLGYRVPLIVASPWSRGGWVNSEVCDISSTIQFLEKFLSQKTGKTIREENISSWRRTISGDLTSVFRPYNGEDMELPDFVDFENHVKTIHSAGFKEIPNNFKALEPEEIRQANDDSRESPWIPRQEPGTKPSNALAYELYAEGNLDQEEGVVRIRFEASNRQFGKKSLGAPFVVYVPGAYVSVESGEAETCRTWSFAVKPGDELNYEWPLENFPEDEYQLLVYGPNGFFREFSGRKNSPVLHIQSEYLLEDSVSGSGLVKLVLENREKQSVALSVSDNAYHQGKKFITLKAGQKKSVRIPTRSSQGWYDFSVQVKGNPTFIKRYCGRLEFGKHSSSDPLMGGELQLGLS
ncbi:phosphocholine-specific phospholipase C [Cyclobacterium jeungdonense]|uniref:phospholipase C n=1 Tax=Cyclobacterium jeungdonense TaxID=708087 RepID=A0ABT8CBT7_9BACT|nr:phospholipase C, phosphocholine-specific [Cyclobacterium jeungdonense]MDN3689990.1 phospholipase C, phosphocholine-specific [Cyclobacterium jeungdonense]